jgi:glucose/arabinose dehydrogenase
MRRLIISAILMLLWVAFGAISADAQDLSLTEAFPETFSQPLGMVYSHQDDPFVYVVRRRGFIDRLDTNNPGQPSVQWLNISSRVQTGGERGLLGLAFHPDYPSNETFYLYYTFAGEDDATFSALSRFNAPGGVADPDSEERLIEFEQPASNHNGGQLAFGPDGYLYLGTGDGGGGNIQNSQNTLNFHGNIIRIDVDGETGYSIPPENPFVGDPDGLDEIYAWGFRNPWRFSFDSETGFLWLADVGQSDWESIYIVEKGKNYGWPIVEGSHCFPIGSTCDKTGLEMPVFEYPWGEDDTGRSITGGFVYRGMDNPSLYSNYIYGDFISGRIWALEVDHDAKEVLSNSEIVVSPQMLPSFGVDSNQEIYVLGWGESASIFRFEPEETSEPPGVVSLVSPEDGAVDVSVDPVLSWEAEPQAASYRLQVSLSGDFASTVVDEVGIEMTEFEISDLAFETNYFWRVLASNDAGDGDWSEIWSFVTEEEPLSPPGIVTLIAPEDGATDVSVDPVLSWEAVEQGAGYRVQVSGDAGFTSLIVDEAGIEETEFGVSGLDFETTYYWRVQASNEAGDGDWSEVWSFTTEEEPLSPPGIVTLIFPEDGATDVSVDPVLSWEAVEQGAGYRVQVSGDAGFTSLIVDEAGLEETEFGVSGLDYETTYFWRVLATNNAGDGEWSQVWSFVTEEEPVSPPGVVTLIAPEDGAVDVAVDPVLSWEAVEQGAGYRVQVASDSEFGDLVVDEAGIEETEFEVTGLDYETTYFWRVLASNDAGDGEWSEVWSFTTEEEPLSLPGVVALVSPEDGATDVAVDPVLSWEAELQASSYRLQVAFDSEFGDLVLDADDIEVTEFEMSGLEYETAYFWRVLASNQAGDGDWSEVWSFSTEEEPLSPPGVVTLVSPEDEATDVSVDPVLSWEAVEQGAGYRVQVSGDAGFTSLVVDEASLEETEFGVSGLDYETTYFWRVLASNDAGDGDWSEVWSFTTEEEPLSPPGVVALISPEDGAVDVAVDPVLSWEAVAQGTGYRVQVSGDAGFTSLIVDEAGLEETEFEVSGLDFETTYFWRVMAINDAGDGEWSQVWSFVTEEEPLVPVVSSLELRVEGDVITIEWEAEAAAQLDFFRIYRGPDPQELSEVAVRDASERSFSESSQTGSTVFYAVSAVSNSGSETELSEPVSFFTDEAEIIAEWRMISIPIQVEELTAEGAILYGFNGVYRSEEVLKPGRGYWAKSSGNTGLQIPLSGAGLVSEVMELRRGWNLVGSLAAGILVSEIEDPGSILTTAPVYEFDGTMYREADVLMPGAGYWIYAGNDGVVELRLKAGKADTGKSREPLAAEITGRLTFRYLDYHAELRLSDVPLSADEKYRYLMPPVAPGPSLDVRTADGFRVVDQQFERISLQSPGYPVTIEAEMEPGQQGAMYRLSGRDENGTVVEFDLKPGRIITLNEELTDLQLERLTPEELVTTTRLDPGYPNPFNPSTNIRYRLADASDVQLVVFDLSGRRIVTLVNEVQQAGSYTVQFDASGLASGIYLVTLRADGLLRTQKVTLVK